MYVHCVCMNEVHVHRDKACMCMCVHINKASSHDYSCSAMHVHVDTMIPLRVCTDKREHEPTFMCTVSDPMN